MEIIRQIYGDIPLYRTGCCALGQLSLSDQQSLEEIKELIRILKIESAIPMTVRETQNYGGKERALFVITLPHEIILVENLTKLGFKEIAEFHRRNCYPQDEMLKMWFLAFE